MRRVVLLLVLLLPASAGAEECPPRPVPCVAWWARPSESPHDIGYYVGGGVGKRHGEPRRPDEGTWGWDYVGLLPRRIVLWWGHGRRCQGGTGAYRTE
jgi:hypothetical protein